MDFLIKYTSFFLLLALTVGCRGNVQRDENDPNTRANEEELETWSSTYPSMVEVPTTWSPPHDWLNYHQDSSTWSSPTEQLEYHQDSSTWSPPPGRLEYHQDSSTLSSPPERLESQQDSSTWSSPPSRLESLQDSSTWSSPPGRLEYHPHSSTWSPPPGRLKYHQNPATWNDARERCQSEGAILASPLTDQLKADIISLVKLETSSEDEQEIFTGVHAIFSKGDYSSIEGVPLLRLAITWAPGEPDNFGNLERCLSMKIGHNTTMSDTGCDRMLPYVCYRKDTNVVELENDTEYEYKWDEQMGWSKYPVAAGTWNEIGEMKKNQFRFDYEWSERAEGWLKYHVVPATADEARSRCQAEGASLASPITDVLNTAVTAYAQNHKIYKGVSVFTGIQRPFYIKEYEFNNYSDRCLAMTLRGDTFYTSCNERVLPYFCFKDDTQLTMSECGTTDPEYVFENRTGSCYKFHNHGVIWYEAYMTCAAEGGYLAIINNDLEAEVVRETLARQPLETFFTHYGYHLTAVGLYDWSNIGRNFSTIHGEPLEANYHTWHAREPNNYPNTLTNDPGEYCGTVGRDGELYDYPCHVPTAFICEKMPDSLL